MDAFFEVCGSMLCREIQIAALHAEFGSFQSAAEKEALRSSPPLFVTSNRLNAWYFSAD